MKNSIKILSIGLMAAVLFLTACNNDDDTPDVIEKRYTLSALDSSGVSGNVTFRKMNATTTLIIVQLTGTQAGDSHPAHIHANSALAGGSIVVDFTPVNGETGRSETTVTALKDGTAITYEGLIAYNGHVNIHKSVAEIAIMIAQGNIGSNATAEAK